MIKKVLVGLDGSPLAERALSFVEMLAAAGSAEVTLVRAVPPPRAEPLVHENPNLLPYMVSMPVARPEAEVEVARNERHEAERYLDGVAERLGQKGVPVRTVVVEGDPARVLAEEADLRGVDLIALGTHGRSGIGRWVYGSIAEGVVARSAVPVYLARAWPGARLADSGDHHAPILVPLDGSERAESALPIASGLSLQLGAPLHLLQVIPPPDDVAVPQVGWGPDLSRSVVDGQEIAARNHLAELVRRLRSQGIEATAGVEVGAIAEEIVHEERERGVSLVVMATHAGSALRQALVGSTALDVLRRGSASVVLLGPAAVGSSD